MAVTSGGVLRTLTAGVVDYAGLFPPASLPMAEAVRSYTSYRLSADAPMLGRFVVPVTRLDEWEAAVSALEPSLRDGWRGARISALLSGEFAAEAATMQAFNAAAPHGTLVDAAEGRVTSPDAVLAMAAAMPDDVTLYCEVPHRDDPRDLIAAVRSAGVRAKIRMGGVTADAFPAPADVVRFVRRCHEAGVTAKATAGLHHPLRGSYRLTYAPDAPVGEMYGYLNIFSCAAAIAAGADDAAATSVLMAESVDVSRAGSEIVIGGVTIPAVAVAAMRETGLVAFGSCSFREPVDELAAIFPL